jgi:hypothetical protein
MTNEFTFQSVGHGLFYTGSLLNGKYNFVYDCGGNKDPLKKAISDYTAKVEKIDFLVVSHLDKDHVAGIYYLHKACKQIEKIYLPYLETDGLVIELTIANFLSTRLEQNDLLDAFHWWVKVYNNNEDSGTKSVIVSEETPPPGPETEEPYWHFEMFNKIKNGKIKNMPVDVAAIDKDLKIFLGGKKIEDCLFDPNDCRILKQIYKTHCSSINGSSTILIHYPANDRDNILFSPGNYKRLEFHLYNKPFMCIQKRPATTILTGDAEFDEDMLYKMKDIISKREKDIKIFQVPHHGAEKNWDLIELVKFDFDIYVIPFKYGDKDHPHRKVILELTLERKYIQLVTQREKSSYSYNIYYSVIGDQQVVPITQTPIPIQP